MNGSRGRSNNFLLDGTDMNDGYRNDPAINEAGVFGDPATILPHRRGRRVTCSLQLTKPSTAATRRRDQHRDQERHQRDTRFCAGEYFRNGKMGARNYFNFATRCKESIQQQSIRRRHRWRDREGQNFLLRRL